MVLHLRIGPLKPTLGWSRYRDTNPIPTNPLAVDITTTPSGQDGKKRRDFDHYQSLVIRHMQLTRLRVRHLNTT